MKKKVISICFSNGSFNFLSCGLRTADGRKGKCGQK